MWDECLFTVSTSVAKRLQGKGSTVYTQRCIQFLEGTALVQGMTKPSTSRKTQTLHLLRMTVERGDSGEKLDDVPFDTFVEYLQQVTDELAAAVNYLNMIVAPPHATALKMDELELEKALKHQARAKGSRCMGGNK